MKKKLTSREKDKLDIKAWEFFELLNNEAKESFIIARVKRSKAFKQYLAEEKALLHIPSLFAEYGF